MFQTAPAAVSDAQPDDPRGIVTRYFRAWNDGDASIVDQLIGDDWVDHAHPERRNAEDVARAIGESRATRPATRVLVDAVLGDGELVTVNGRIEDGARTEGRVWLVRVQDGRLREIWTYSAD